jgi:hypothetical protein
MDPLYRRFKEQQNKAKQRGIAWRLPYWEWLQIWQDSGHLDERGVRSGQWVMARPGDVGAYEAGNVRIVHVETNHREGQVTRRRHAQARAEAAGGVVRGYLGQSA